MGFIRAAFTSLKEVYRDGKFLEFVSIPESIDNDVIAIKGTLHTSDPDGVRRQSNNKTTGLISDGSHIFVPQGYVAIAVSNGEMLTDMAYTPGIYTWNTGQNKTLFFDEQGVFSGLRSSWNQFKERFKYGGQTIDQQEIVYIKMQPIMGVKFGTQSGVEFMSPTYRNLSIRFFGICDIVVDDPVTFYLQIVSRKIGSSGVYHFSEISDVLRKHLPTNIGVALSKYALEKNYEVPQMNAILLELGNEIATTITQSWSTVYGLGLQSVIIEDISYDERSQKIVDEFDNILRKTGNPAFVQYEAMQRHYDVMEKMASNEAKGESFNAMAGVAMMPMMANMMQGMMNPMGTIQPGQTSVPQPPLQPQNNVASSNQTSQTQSTQYDGWNTLKQEMNQTSTQENDDPLNLLNK